MTAIQEIGRLTHCYDTKANILADDFGLREIQFAYATDTNELGIYINGTWIWLATGSGAGTVTSVALTVPSILSVSGSPITGAGTLAVTLATEAANKVFKGPNSGGAATPTFASLVAADLPNTAVTPGSYTLASLTVDAQGRITAASNGSGGGVTGSGAAGEIAAWSGASALTGSGLYVVDFSSSRAAVAQYAYSSTLAPLLAFWRARGTSGSPTASQAGDALLRLDASGYGASAFSSSARATLQAVASENWTNSAQGTAWQFQVTPAGSIIPYMAFGFSEYGPIFSGKTPGVSNSLVVYHPDNTNTGSDAFLDLISTGAGGGSPYISLDIDGVMSWYQGVDNADSDKYKLGAVLGPIFSNDFLVMTTAGDVSWLKKKQTWGGFDIQFDAAMRIDPTGVANGDLLAYDLASATWKPVAGSGTGTVTSVATGTGLTGGPVTSSGTISLANTAVTPGSYTNVNLTVDQQGRITAISNGSPASLELLVQDGVTAPPIALYTEDGTDFLYEG